MNLYKFNHLNSQILQIDFSGLHKEEYNLYGHLKKI